MRKGFVLITIIGVIGLSVWYYWEGQKTPGDVDGKPDLLSGQEHKKQVKRNNSAALDHDYAVMRKQQISSVDYQFSVVLDKTQDKFSGIANIDLQLQALPLQAVTIDFRGGSIDSLRLNKKKVDFEYNGNYISLAPRIFDQTANKIEIAYQHPYSKDGTGLHRFVDPEDGNIYLYTQFEPFEANRVFPLFDQPDIKATYGLDVIAPSDWIVVSAGSVTEQKQGAENTHWYFQTTPLLSTYVLSLHAGAYHIWEDKWQEIPLRLFARKSMARYIDIEDWLTPTKKFLTYFNDYFGIAYPFSKYDQLIVPDFNFGAMENAAAVTFSERFVYRGDVTQAQRHRLAEVIAHEMAHMWFGDLVTMQWWNGLWLNESFATIMSNLALDSTGYEDVWEKFYSKTKQWAYWTDELVTTHPIELPVNNTAEAFSNFDGITYGKGASVLKQLMHYLGNETFRQGVNRYLTQHAYKNTTLADFVTSLAQVANKPLDQWQQMWLYEAGLNTIEMELQCQEAKIHKIDIRQSAPQGFPTLREQRIQIAMYQQVNERIKQVATQAVTYNDVITPVSEMNGLPCPDIIYPNAEDWGYVKVSLDQASKKNVFNTINRFDSNLMRLMLWQGVWDSVRDAKMSLYDYIEFVLANIPSEHNIDVQRLAQDNIASAFDYLAYKYNSERAREYRQKLEQFAWQSLDEAKPGSDSQQDWFSTFNSLAHSELALKRLQAMLENKLILDGLEIDQDKRWNILLQLNKYRYVDYMVLTERERSADESERARKLAIAAQAARPELSSKQRWVDVFVDEQNNVKLDTIRKAANSLFPANQAQLHEQFATDILDSVAKVSATENSQFINVFSDLIPATCNTKSTERLTEAVRGYSRKDSSIDPQLYKALKIALQEDERCVKIVNNL